MKRLLYRWFSSFAAFQYRLDRRCTRAGSLALGVLGAAIVIGLDTNRTVGYQVFTLVLALVVLSVGSSLVFRGRFAARRRTMSTSSIETHAVKVSIGWRSACAERIATSSSGAT